MSFCSACGTAAGEGAQYCAKCGGPLAAGAAAPRVHAGFMRRYAAAAIDLVFIGGLWSFALLAVTRLAPLTDIYDVMALAYFPIAIAYYSLLEGVTGTTPGKLAAGIRVVNRAGGKPGIRAISRSLGKLVSLLTFGYGFVMAAFTAQRRALHDTMAGTLVVSRRATAADVVIAGKAMPITAGIPLLALVATGLVFATPIVALMKLDEARIAARERLRPLTIEELGQRSPDEPLRNAIPISRVQGGMVDDGRPIIPSAASSGRSEAVVP